MFFKALNTGIDGQWSLINRKQKIHKRKIENLTSSKWKSAHQKTTLENERPEENILQSTYLVKYLCPECVKNSWNSIIRKQSNKIDKRFEWKIYRWYTDGKLAQQKQLNPISHWEMHIQTPVRYHYNPLKWLKLKKTFNTKWW